jgi:hypothetical protein
MSKPLADLEKLLLSERLSRVTTRSGGIVILDSPWTHALAKSSLQSADEKDLIAHTAEITIDADTTISFDGGDD